MDITLSIKFKFALTAAAVCCPVEAGDDTSGIVWYLNTVLEPVFGDAGIHVDVTPVPYPPCSKLPVAITLNRQEPRLLWYHKGMSALELSDELFWLLSDLPLVTGRIPA